MTERAMKPIPIWAAKKIAKDYGYDQVIVYARRVGESPHLHGEHLTTYGVNKEHCSVAGRIGSYLKREIFKWQEDNSDNAKWESVDTLLPVDDRKVIATYVNELGKRRTIMAMYVRSFEMEANPEDEIDIDWSEDEEMCYLKAGWYERVENWPEWGFCPVLDGRIDYWCRLPKMPEDSHDE